MKHNIPDFSNYTSNRVFDGVRVLTGKEADMAILRIKRAIEKYKTSKKVVDKH